MKPIAIAITLGMFAGIAAADQDPPRHIRVALQYVEVSHPVLTELLGGAAKNGNSLHKKVLAHIPSGNARIIETCIAVSRSGQRTTFESLREEVSPTEYEPPGSIGDRWLYHPPTRNYTAFDTRNTGEQFEVESTIQQDNRLVDLRFYAELVAILRHDTWKEHIDQWGDASIRMPVFETLRTNTTLQLESGKFELVTVITPRVQPAAPSASRRILLFVRADVLSGS